MDKTDVSKMISNTVSLRDKIILSLLVSGMRSIDLRSLKPSSIKDNQIIIKANIGKYSWKYHISKNIVNNLNEFIKKEHIEANQHIFPISHYVVSNIVKKSGHSIGKDLNSYRLRRWAIETYFQPKKLHKLIKQQYMTISRKILLAKKDIEK